MIPCFLLLTTNGGTRKTMMPLCQPTGCHCQNHRRQLTMTNMPEEIFAYEDDGATGTWINFDDSCHRTGDVATNTIAPT